MHSTIRVEEAKRQSAEGTSIGRLIEPEEIALLMLFLISNKASAITGQAIAIEGGAGRRISY